MFEYNLSYYNSRFHKTGEKPFSFPPDGMPPVIDANIIEIEGDNGTGKTTFLNCVALALGYLDERKELGQKRRLIQRLQLLENNESLAYYFKITSPIPGTPNVSISKEAGKQSRFKIGSKNVDLIDIKNQFDVIFLTDDDPRKDVKNSLTMISSYLKDYEEQLNSLTTTIGMQLVKIRNYKLFKEKEEKYLSEIENSDTKIDDLRKQIEEKKRILELVKARDLTKKKMALVNDRERISTRFDELQTLYKELESSEQPELMHKIGLIQRKHLLAKQEKDSSENRVSIFVRNLRKNSVLLNAEKLLSGDRSEFDELLEQYLETANNEIQEELIEDLLGVFNRYSGDEVVPYLEKSVEEIVDGLSQEQMKLSKSTNKNQIYNFLQSLDGELNVYATKEREIEKLQDKITEYSAKIKNLEKFDDVQKELQVIGIQYVELQEALGEVGKLTSEWKKLSFIQGEVQPLEIEVQQLEIDKKTEETLRSRAEQNLAYHRESACAEPKNYQKEKNIEQLSEEVLSLRTKLTQWISILQRDYSDIDDKKTNRTKDKFPDEDEFIQAVGDYIGSTFEPVDYIHQKWDIKSYNLKTQSFVTKDDREIPLDELSRGQTRKLSLVKILKEMTSQKKRILLVDEIADLDVNNLNWIRETLKEKLADGSLMLAIMVRPMTQKSDNVINIRGIA